MIKVLRRLIFCLTTSYKYATLDLDAFEFDSGCISLLKGPDSWGDDWVAVSLPLLLRLLIEFKPTLASCEIKVILDLLILILKRWWRVQHVLAIAGQTAHDVESESQDTLELWLLLLDDLLLECYLVIGLVWLELFFHFSDFPLHHNDFATLLFHKLHHEFQMLSLVSVALREDMTKLRDSATGIGQWLRRKFAAEENQEHQNVGSSSVMEVLTSFWHPLLGLSAVFDIFVFKCIFFY